MLKKKPESADLKSFPQVFLRIPQFFGYPKKSFAGKARKSGPVYKTGVNLQNGSLWREVTFSHVCYQTECPDCRGREDDFNKAPDIWTASHCLR